jgi:hypothetical protein
LLDFQQEFPTEKSLEKIVLECLKSRDILSQPLYGQNYVCHFYQCVPKLLIGLRFDLYIRLKANEGKFYPPKGECTANVKKAQRFLFFV